MAASGQLIAVVLPALLASCAGAPFPRETRATNCRTDDLWLEGTQCAAGSSEDPELRVEEIEPGRGRPVGKGETVRVHYTALLQDGTTVHSTREKGPPVEIIIGSTKTICGFEKALVGMRPGGQRRVVVPWQLAFGDAGRPPDIQPRTDLTFVVDLFLPADVVSEPHGGAAPPNPAMGPRRQ
jgi:peptidylprolyl isomerase